MSIDSGVILEKKHKEPSILATGLALFSMFFGAGNLVFPLLIGRAAGSENISALAGLSISAVIFPFLGLVAMTFYGGDLKKFLSRLGKGPAFGMMFFLFMSQGPVGAMPRLITLMHASIKGYMPALSLGWFSVLIAIAIFAMAIRPSKIIALIGIILTPLLLATLAALIGFGLFYGKEPLIVSEGTFYYFKEGLKGGYQTLDLAAALLFSSVIMRHLSGEEGRSPKKTVGEVRRKILGASAIASGLLMISYIGLSFLASYYSRTLGRDIEDVDLLYTIAVQVLGPWGSLLATSAVFLACLTTAVSLASVFSEYLHQEWFRRKPRPELSLVLTLSASAAMATLGFSGIMKILGPCLEILYPSLIVLCLFNIAHHVYQVKPIKIPVFATLAIGLVGFITGRLG